MQAKFSEKQLIEIAKSGLSDMTCEQIKQLIYKESMKDYESIDNDFIDLCFYVLSIKQKNQKQETKKFQLERKKMILRKAVIIAAVFSTFVFATLTISANVFHFNIPSKISSFIKGDSKTDINLKATKTTADGYSLEDTNLAKKLKEEGISPVTFPESLINKNTKIIKIENVTTDKTVSTDVVINFINNNVPGVLSISQYTNDFEWTGEIVDKNISSAEMINANGMDILIFESKDNCTIRYKDNLIFYEIYLETDLKNAKRFAKSIK